MEEAGVAPLSLGLESPSLRVLSWVSSNLLKYTGKKPGLSCSLPAQYSRAPRSRLAQIPTAGLTAPNRHTLCMSGHADHTEHMDWSYMLTVVLSSLQPPERKAGPACLWLMKANAAWETWEQTKKTEKPGRACHLGSGLSLHPQETLECD